MTRIVRTNMLHDLFVKKLGRNTSVKSASWQNAPCGSAIDWRKWYLPQLNKKATEMPYPPIVKAGMLLMLLLCLQACREAASKEPAVDAVLVMENDKKSEADALRKLATRYATAWSGTDPAAVANFFTTDGSLRINDHPPSQGREAITEVARTFMVDFPDMEVTLDSLVETADGLQFYWTFTGTYAGPEGPGNKVKISGLEIWQLTPEGLVQSSQGRFDEEAYQSQITSTPSVEQELEESPQPAR